MYKYLIEWIYPSLLDSLPFNRAKSTIIVYSLLKEKHSITLLFLYKTQWEQRLNELYPRMPNFFSLKKEDPQDEPILIVESVFPGTFTVDPVFPTLQVPTTETHEHHIL